MDLSPNPDVERFREEFRAWLAQHQPGREANPLLGGSHADEPARIEFLRRWQRSLHEAGYVAVHFPSEAGGRGLSLLHHVAVSEELVRSGAPPLINGPSLSISGPTLLACGSPEQQRRYLRHLLSADDVWCLGFSEPGAGSDLAALRTTAVRDGDDFVLNGQKVWTTYAHYADFGLFLVRTAPELPRHKGLSVLIVPMRSRGITVRPLREITGGYDFNEVFLEDVRVPATNLVGGENRGWPVILTALGHERGTLLVVDRVRHSDAVEKMRAHVAGDPTRRTDPLARQALARHWVDARIQEIHSWRILSDLEQHRPPTEASILKLFGSEATQRTFATGLALDGPYGLLYDGSRHLRDEAAWQRGHLMNFSLTIASGTSEVQRNIIAERLLGLPAGK